MRSALGKGLTQLIGEQADASPSSASISTIAPNRNQPRTHFEPGALQELAESIKLHGVLQPLVVRPLREGAYELIAGERRLRAAQLAGLKEVPILIRSADPKASLEMALIENIQREDIAPLECARAYQSLAHEFGLTQEAIAERVGKSRVTITNTLRLLRLPQRVLAALESNVITEGHARALLGAESEALCLAIFDVVVERGLSVRQTEELVKGSSKKPTKNRTSNVDIDPTWRSLQDALSHRFGSPVKLQGSERGGRIVVDFHSEDDLARIVEALGIEL